MEKLTPHQIKLTQTVQKGGCAAKVAALELREILAQVSFPPNSTDVLIDGHLMDDAGVVKVSDQVALVQTLDFFTPIVDSPYKFGQIAAANSLSDVYAMGGRPQTAMAILAFPLISMDKAVIVEVLQGACDKIKESKASLVGGHSIDDDTLKFGLSVTGYVHPQKIWANSGAQSGDILILTKALGTGAATAALKRQDVQESDIETELNSMSELNNVVDYLDVDDIAAIHSATDVTGFGLAGHAIQMARASEKIFKIKFQQLPIFAKTIEFLQAGYLTKAHRTNKEYVIQELQTENISDVQRQVLFDPQTSGGLLLSVKKEMASSIVSKLIKKNKFTSIIGEVVEQIPSHKIRLTVD